MFPTVFGFLLLPGGLPENSSVKSCSFMPSNPNRSQLPQYTLQRKSGHKPVLAYDISEPKKKTDASLITENTDNIKGPLLLSCSGQNILQFLFQNTLAAILPQGAKEGKSLFLQHYHQARGKTRGLTHTNRALPLTSYSQTSPTSYAFCLATQHHLRDTGSTPKGSLQSCSVGTWLLHLLSTFL